MASYDVASSICQAVLRGDEPAQVDIGRLKYAPPAIQASSTTYSQVGPGHSFSFQLDLILTILPFPMSKQSNEVYDPKHKCTGTL
jgi:hypothetical protein